MERVLEQMVREGVIDADGAGRAHQLMLTQSKPLDEAVVASGAANEEAALKFFSEHFGVPMAGRGRPSDATTSSPLQPGI